MFQHQHYYITVSTSSAMLRAGDPYYVMDLHTSISTGSYEVGDTTHQTRVKFGGPTGKYLSSADGGHALARLRVQKIYDGYVHRGMINDDDFKVDVVTASSLSWGSDTKGWIQFMFSLITSDGAPKPLLSITDAGAGCGGDTLQFMLAFWPKADDQTHNRWPNVFSHVNAIELDTQRHMLLTHNVDLVRQAYVKDSTQMDPFEPTVLLGDYQRYIDNPAITQDVLYLDPPWGGEGEGDKRVGDLHMWHSTDTNDKGDNVHDIHFSVLTIVRATMAKNTKLDDAGTTEGITRFIVLKTPYIWECEMRDELSRAVKNCRVYPGDKNQFFIYFLRDEDSLLLADEGYKPMDPDGPCRYYEPWTEQQRFLKENFQGFDEDLFKAHKPMFLQNVWPMDEMTVFQPNTKIPNTIPYIPGARENSTMHNGEAKLLQSSLFTIMYGLKRGKQAMERMREDFNRDILYRAPDSLLAEPLVKEGEVPRYKAKPPPMVALPPITWDYVLSNTIVLYIGAAGLNAKTHHFNSLLHAIPKVHFCCYDVRHLATELSQDEMKDRVTVFHSMFTENDMDRWAAFCHKYTNKNLIIISDIRSDWEQARLECEASKKVLRMKMWQLKLKAVAHASKKYPTEGAQQTAEVRAFLHRPTSKRDQFSQAGLLVHDAFDLRTQIDQLCGENRGAQLWIDDVIKRDSYVQWRWCQAICNKRSAPTDKRSTTCAIFSMKTREPYQTVSHPGDLTQFYYTVPGVELLQKYTDSSTETRTQVTSKHYSLSVPVWLDVNTNQYKPQKYSFLDVKTCVQHHFKSFGDPTSFISERVDYQRTLGNTDTPQEQFSGFPMRSVALHDIYLAHYNQDRKHNRQKQAVDGGIRQMYRVLYGEIHADRKKNNGIHDDKEWSAKSCDEYFNGLDAKLLKKLEAGRDQITDKIPIDAMVNKNQEEFTTDVMSNMKLTHKQKETWGTEYFERWFSTHHTLLHYDKHLLNNAISSQHYNAAPHIWDMSQQAMEALLILNINLRHDRFHTHETIKWYVNTRVQTNPTMKQWIEDSHVVAEPKRWFFGQLRFNMTRPFVAELYTKQSTAFKHRYDVIKLYMETEVPRLHKVLNEHGDVVNETSLASKPGSATSADGHNYTNHVINTAYKNGHSGMDLPRDWYCYWLQPLLLGRDAYTRSVVADLSDATGAQQIAGAVEPFMYFQGPKDHRARSGYALKAMIKHAQTGRLQQQLLQLESWPQGKPVLFYACEQGCLPMIQYCLFGIDDNAKIRKLNTPRYKPMKMRDIAHVSDAEIAEQQRIHKDKGLPRQEYARLASSNAAGMPQAENYPLHIAAWHGHKDTVDYLLLHGADHTQPNFWGESPLRAAQLSLFNNTPHSVWGDNESRKKAVARCIEHLEWWESEVGGN